MKSFNFITILYSVDVPGSPLTVIHPPLQVTSAEAKGVVGEVVGVVTGVVTGEVVEDGELVVDEGELVVELDALSPPPHEMSRELDAITISNLRFRLTIPFPHKIQ